MDIKQEKKNRIKYLKAVYEYALQVYPISPTNVMIGLKEDKKYDFSKKEFINNDEEKVGFIIGEQIGLSQEDVKRIVFFCVNQKWLSSGMGMLMCMLTPEGINYIESLEEEQKNYQQTNPTIINVGDIHAPTQIQANTNHSTQTITYQTQDVLKFFELLEEDIKNLEEDLRQEFYTEIEYAKKQLAKGNDIKTQLLNIGKSMSKIGLDVFKKVASSTIFELIKPYLNL